MQRVTSRLRSIVRLVPGARPLRRRILKYRAARRSPEDTEAPRGFFDRPDGLTVPRGVVAFDGWALVGKYPVEAVDVVLNDVMTVRASLGTARPDVWESLHEQGKAVACGWVATIDLTGWPLGDLRVKAIATSPSGISSVIGYRQYTLTGQGFEGYIDEPREGATLHGDLLVVRGWATIGHQPVSRIDVHLNGRRVGLARLRVVRSDVDRHSHGRLGPVTGFEYRGVVAPIPSQDLEIGITAHALDDSVVAVPVRRIRMAPPDDSIGATAPTTLQARTRASLAAATVPEEAPNRRTGPRLLVFTHSLTLGGGQLYLSSLLSQLVPALDQCIVVSPVDGMLRADLESHGITVMILDEPLATDPERYEEQICERALFIRGSGCDVVMLNTLGPWSAGDACIRIDMPYIWSIHESFELSDWSSLNFGATGLPGYLRQRMAAALGAARALVFEARATSELFARYAGATRRTVVPYTVDAAAMGDFERGFDRGVARRKHNIPQAATVLLAMGIFEERKSQACIVEAFAAVADVHPNARLILVGDHPCEYSDAIHHMISTSTVSERIWLEPITPSIWEWYALSDMLVSASDIESLPRSMLESMGLEVPVLSTSVFGVPELIEDGVNGWLFEPRDMAALTAALHRVLSLMPDERRAVGRASKVTMQQRHSAPDYVGAYRELLADASTARSVG
jgi:D-inositol-3-phosphate glycosyltransferase